MTGHQFCPYTPKTSLSGEKEKGKQQQQHRKDLWNGNQLKRELKISMQFIFSVCIFLVSIRNSFKSTSNFHWSYCTTMRLIEIEFTLTDALIACWCFHKEEEKNSLVKFIIIFGWILQLIVCAFFSVYKFISDSFTLKKQDWINLRLGINIQTIRN